MKLLRKIITAAILTLTTTLSYASTLLYDVDFTSPEVGSYQTIFGTPVVQSSVGTLSDALVFHAVTGYNQIKFSISNISPHFDIEYDVLAHNLLNSQYAFTMLLDTPEVRTVDLHGGMNQISLFPGSLAGAFENDKVYHFKISVDFTTNIWAVTIDGAKTISNTLYSTSLNSIRFNMAPWIGGAVDAPTVYAALDNIHVTAVPEPSFYSLIIIPGIITVGVIRRKKLLP